MKLREEQILARIAYAVIFAVGITAVYKLILYIDQLP